MAGRPPACATAAAAAARALCLLLVCCSAAALAPPPASPRVLCHGELLFDCIALPNAAGWDLQRVVADGAWRKYAGGAPANVACALAKLGTAAAFCGAVGEDADAGELREVLQKCGVDTSLLSTVPGGITRRCMVTRDASGDRTFAGFEDDLPSAAFADTRHTLPATRPLGDFGWLVQGTLGLATPASEASHEVLAPLLRDSAQRSGRQLRHMVDVNWRPVFWPNVPSSMARSRILEFTERADVVKLTDEEAEWLLGVPADTALESPQAVREKLPAAAAVLVTAGERGAAFDVLGHTGRVLPFDVKVVETTGAGDAFTAGFIHALQDFNFGVHSAQQHRGPLSAAERARVDAALRFASAVGALTCMGDGAIGPQPSLEQAERFLAAAAAA